MNFPTKTPQRLFGTSDKNPSVTSNEAVFENREYEEVWSELSRAIADANFFNGSITTQHKEFTSHLTTTLIIYRDKSDPEEPITDIVPVWWEMKAYGNESSEPLANDFSFCLLREVVLLHH